MSLSQTTATLDEWGSRLFNIGAPPAPKSGATGTRRRPSSQASLGGRLPTPEARAQFVRQKLQQMVRRAPQVMVKIAKAP